MEKEISSLFDFEGPSKKEYKPEKLREDVTNGGVAQLGEHLPCKQGVMGSNPIISTRNFRKKISTLHFSLFTLHLKRRE